MHTEYDDSNAYFRNSDIKEIDIKTLHVKEIVMLLFWLTPLE